MRTYTGSTSCDDRATRGNNKGKIMVNLKENVRDPDEIKRLNDQCEQYNRPPHYDLNKAQRNITYENCLTTEEAFMYVLGESMERFNAQQNRSDRKTSLEKELAKLEKGKVKQELIHTMIIQVGNKDSRPDEAECVEILNEYLEQFRAKFPNMKLVSAAIHLDEDTPHLQIYFIPVKTKRQHEEMETGKKWSGMDVQPSLKGALLQMGYTNDATKTTQSGKVVMDYQNGAMAQWQRDFNALLDEICRNHDIEIDHYQRGQKVSHEDTLDFQEGRIQRDVINAKNELKQADADLTNTLYETQTAQGSRDDAIRERDAAIKERDAARQETQTFKAQMEAMKAELSAWARKLQQGVMSVFHSLDVTRKKLDRTPWLSAVEKERISDVADGISMRTEQAVTENQLDDVADYMAAYDKVEKERWRADDLADVAKGNKPIEVLDELMDDGWER